MFPQQQFPQGQYYPPFYQPMYYPPPPQTNQHPQMTQIYQRAYQKKIQEEPRFLRNPQKLSYLDLFQTVLNDYENSHSIVNEQQFGGAKQNSSYSLFEDVKLLNQILLNDANNETFKKIIEEQIIDRSYESIKTRCQKYLKNLKQTHMDQILAHIQQHGMNGYIHFEKSPNGERQFKYISNHLIPKKSPFKNNQQESSAGKVLSPSRVPISSFYPPVQKRKRSPSPISLGNETFNKQQKINPELADKKTPSKQKLEHKHKVKAYELDLLMTLICNWTKKDKRWLVKCLDKTSGDIEQLFQYLETNDSNMLWEQEDDETLFDKKTTNMEKKLLEKAKGIERIQKRLEYCH